MSRVERLIWAFALLLVLCRVAGVDRVPYGFTGDEATGALHALCLAETGHDAHGTAWPLFVNQFESPFQELFQAGEVPPTYLYVQTAWVKAFGASITSVRVLNGVLVAALTLATAWLADLLFASSMATACAALSAAAAPAFFHIVRLATMVPLGPLLLVVAVALAVSKPSLFRVGLSGLCFGLAAVSYPPLKVQAAALVVVWFGFAAVRERARDSSASLRLYVPGALLFAAVAIPLAIHSVSPAATLRATFLSIFSEQYAHTAGESHPGLAFYARTLATNMWEHLDPRFLFIHGDANLRHSTGFFGALSWGDGLAFFLAAAAFGLAWFRGHPRVANRGHGPAVAALILSVVFGILPSALTWEGVPHVLRSMGAYPFFCILSGGAIARAGRQWRWAPQLFLTVSVVFAMAFGWVYFTIYPRQAYGAWEPQFRVAAERAMATHDWSEFTRFASDPRKSKIALRYYPLVMGGSRDIHQCTGSADTR